MSDTSTYIESDTYKARCEAFKAYNAAYRLERLALTASNNGTGTIAAFFAASDATQAAYAAYQEARRADNAKWQSA